MSRTSDPPATSTDFKAGMKAKDAANLMLEKLDGISIPDSALPAANLVAAGSIHGRLQVQAPPLSEDLRARNIALFYKYIEFENARDYKNLEKLFHPTEFRSTTYFGGDPIAPRALTRMLRGLFRSFPDWYMTVSEIVGADSMGCAGLVTGRGTQVEEFFGRPPADHQVAIPTIHAIRVDAAGLIIEHRHSNPFEDVFNAQVMAPQSEDVQAVRAQQGYDSDAARRAYDIALRAGTSENDLADLRTRVETGKRMCQALLKETLRRCSFQGEPGDIYCKLHQTSGYGVDGIDEMTKTALPKGEFLWRARAVCLEEANAEFALGLPPLADPTKATAADMPKAAVYGDGLISALQKKNNDLHALGIPDGDPFTGELGLIKAAFHYMAESVKEFAKANVAAHKGDAPGFIDHWILARELDTTADALFEAYGLPICASD